MSCENYDNYVRQAEKLIHIQETIDSLTKEYKKNNFNLDSVNQEMERDEFDKAYEGHFTDKELKTLKEKFQKEDLKRILNEELSPQQLKEFYLNTRGEILTLQDFENNLAIIKNGQPIGDDELQKILDIGNENIQKRIDKFEEEHKGELQTILTKIGDENLKKIENKKLRLLTKELVIINQKVEEKDMNKFIEILLKEYEYADSSKIKEEDLLLAAYEVKHGDKVRYTNVREQIMKDNYEADFGRDKYKHQEEMKKFHQKKLIYKYMDGEITDFDDLHSGLDRFTANELSILRNKYKSLKENELYELIDKVNDDPIGFNMEKEIVELKKNSDSIDSENSFIKRHFTPN